MGNQVTGYGWKVTIYGRGLVEDCSLSSKDLCGNHLWDASLVTVYGNRKDVINSSTAKHMHAHFEAGTPLSCGLRAMSFR